MVSLFIQKLKQSIQVTSLVVNNMKNLTYIFLFLIPLIAYGEQQNYKALESRVQELENSILDLELNQAGKKFSFSGDFGINYDNFQSDGWTSSPKNRSVNATNIVFELNADAKVSKRLSFYSSLYSSFYMNNNIAEIGPVLEASRPVGGTSFLKLNKAYFDYQIIAEMLVLSAGRLPTTDGPPEHLKDGDERRGTYNSLSYSLPFDGFALTYKGHSLDKKHRYSIRGVFNPGNVIPNTELHGGSEKGKESSVRGQVSKPESFYFATLEYQTRTFRFLDKLTFLLNYATFSLSGPKEKVSRGVLDANKPGDRNVYRISHPEDTAYSAQNYVAYLELENLFKSRFDFYFSYKYTSAQKRGDIIGTIIEDNEGGLLGAQGSTFSLGGFLTNTDISASQQLHGLRYRVNDKLLTGLEYVSTNIGTTPSSFFNRRNSNLYTWMGQGYHTYVTLLFPSQSSSLRFGYINFLRDHYFNNINYSVIDQRIHNTYFSYVLRL
jgi:hypothetical protein